MESAAIREQTITYRDVFRNGNWIRLWAGQTISQLGDFVSKIAFPLLVYEVTKSVVGLGLGFVVQSIPLIVVGPIAGVFVDRVDRRLLLFATDFIRIFCALGLFFSTSTWQLYILALTSSVMQAIFLATYAAVIPQITERQYLKSISLSQMGYRSMQVLGPVVAAGIIGLVHGPRPAFIFDAVTFAAGCFMTLTIQIGRMERKKSEQHFLTDLSVGARFIGSNPIVRYITAYNVFINIAGAAAALGTLLYIKSALGLSATTSDQLYGLIGGLIAGTLVFTTWLISILGKRVPKRTLVLWGPILTGTAYNLFLLHPGTNAMQPIFFAISVGQACTIVPILAFLAKVVPNELRGRVYSFYNALGALTELLAFTIFSTIGTILPSKVLLALTGGVLLLGIPLCTFFLKGHTALRASEEQGLE